MHGRKTERPSAQAGVPEPVCGRITGIADVVSFDENTIVLDTDMGLLTLKGKELHVSRLTLEKGEVDVDGTHRQHDLFLQRGAAQIRGVPVLPPVQVTGAVL